LTEFLQVITADQFMAKLAGFPRLSQERVSLDDSLGRVLAQDALSSENLPEGARSTVDGYAVRAEDTFGASSSIPALFDVAGSIDMGTVPDLTLRPGQAAQIATGGFLPQGADAVVMVEYSNPIGAGCVEILRPLTLGSNVLSCGEDIRTGGVAVPAGRKIRPFEIGLLAALGIMELPVTRIPRVAVISTGDEVIPIGERPRPGQIRDANSHSIRALIRAGGGNPVGFQIVPDQADRLRTTLTQSLEEADLVVLSGGSSVGARDLLVDVAMSLPGAELLAHGVRIRPGKPTLLVRHRDKAILGLPGHPVSALIIAQIFLAPFLQYLQGCPLAKGPAGPRVAAELAAAIHSTSGLEEYVRVRLEDRGDGIVLAHPVFGKSGMLSTLVKAAGIVVVPMNVEGLSKGEAVEAITI
jgi:molybdopterin molybdotransferase